MTFHGIFYYLFLLVKINLSGLPFERKCCCLLNYNSVTVINDLTTLSVQTQTRSNLKRQKERKLKEKPMKFRDLWRLTFAATETRGRNFIKILKYGD